MIYTYIYIYNMVFVESAGIPLVQVGAYDGEDNPF